MRAAQGGPPQGGLVDPLVALIIALLLALLIVLARRPLPGLRDAAILVEAARRPRDRRHGSDGESPARSDPDEDTGER